MGECSVTSKFFIALLGLVFWAAAAGLLYLGISVYITYQHYDELSSAYYTLIPASILMGVAVFMFILGLLGCIGGCKESKCVLAVFFTLLMVILLAEIAAGVLGIVYKAGIENNIETGMKSAFGNYSLEDTLTDEVDYMQNELKCCGLHNYTDWYDTPWGQNHTGVLPGSCCGNGTGVVCEPGDVYDQGCFDLLKNVFMRYFGIIAGVAVAFAVIQILGMIASCILMCRTKNREGFTNLIEDDRGYRA
ncbi:tetraspanin-3-like [Lineus longissimus]|uniref:tetraspanin-3-like n=1 Tax=Lineus longissimus TaxID=88925 RepID=UPI002B4F1B4D